MTPLHSCTFQGFRRVFSESPHQVLCSKLQPFPCMRRYILHVLEKQTDLLQFMLNQLKKRPVFQFPKDAESQQVPDLLRSSLSLKKFDDIIDFLRRLCANHFVQKILITYKLKNIAQYLQMLHCVIFFKEYFEY